ncbi:MAG: thiamine-phosphate diphosphorylase [Candidatus Tectomicrobia bacterium RIFCSPLOWO2_12_FULL_69_37]|nr:MAG: thiamine-phosphate diphosphorylase [Candidatus Tectomicrobia bacterium RIFCSPLOWO2_02_FULL_70_19]OGL66810.1 MAG: thiamine-phosphate diphosphorylase [Candidatus Tectomicrobia bacterium RIFCSPLOWO2_12_FULL_69_37]
MRLDPTLIVITDRAILARASGMPLADAVRAAAAGGATLIQLREKEIGGAEFLRLADELRAALEGSGCALTVNDRVDVALACGAEGAHLGQEDLPLPRARAIAGARLGFGISAGRPEWAAQAAMDRADYIGVGPIYPTGSKATSRAPLGPEGMRAVLARAGGVPAVGIGGVTAENLAPVIAAGARGVAVIGAVMGAPDPGRAAREIRRCIEEARG